VTCSLFFLSKFNIDYWVPNAELLISKQFVICKNDCKKILTETFYSTLMKKVEKKIGVFLAPIELLKK
jgi:hypothetical protein